MKRKKAFISLVYIVVLLGGMLGSFLVSPSTAWETLTGEEGSFGERVETALKANLPLHEELRSFKVSIKLLSGQKEIDNIFFVDHRLIENLTVQDETLADSNRRALQSFVQKFPIVPSLMLIPTACSIDQQLLPSNAILFDQKGWLEKIDQELSQFCYPIDAYSPLFASREESLFYRTDSRPTQLAGYKLYAALGDRLGFIPLPFSAFSIEPLAYGCYGNLYSRWNNGGVRADTVTAYLPVSQDFSYRVTHQSPDGITATYYTLYPRQATVLGNDIDQILGGSSARIDIKSYGIAERRLLIVGDDYADCLVPYLALHYSDITVINPTLCSKGMMEQLSDESYDQIFLAFSTASFLNMDLSTPISYYLKAAEE